MLFGLFGARNVNTPTPSTGTEDDTFKVLKRIPRKDMDVRLGNVVGKIHTGLKSIQRELRKQNRSRNHSNNIRRWVPFRFHPITIYRGSTTNISVEIDGKNWEVYFEGTGWTSEEYLAEMNAIFDKELDDEFLMERTLTRARQLSAVLSGIIAGIISWVVPSAFVGIGILIPVAAIIATIIGLCVEHLLDFYFIHNKWFNID